MKILIKHWILLIIIAIGISGCQNVGKHDLIIKNANVIDVKSGTIHPSMDIVINADSITRITRHQDQTYHAVQIIDGTNQYLLPGLCDMHAHTWWGYKDFFPLLIANGVTGIREMAGNISEVKRIRKKIRNGTIVGPEIISAGAIIDGKPAAWPGSDEADTPEKGREFVRKQKKEGADFIKVYSLLEKNVYLAIADECKKQGISFSGHIPIKVTLEEAVAAGQQSVEHFDGIMEFMSSEKTYFYNVIRGNIKDTTLRKSQNFLVQTFDKTKLDDLISLLSNNDVWIVPTWVPTRYILHFNDPDFLNDGRVDYMPEYVTGNWDPKRDRRYNTITDADYKPIGEWNRARLAITKPMLDGGVKFLAGTDYPNPYCFPGFSLHDELQIFVEEAGLTPLEALQTATINPAIFLKMETKLGSVEEGKLANLILLSANPLENINNTRQIEGVVLRGKYHDGSTLRKRLEEIARVRRFQN